MFTIDLDSIALDDGRLVMTYTNYPEVNKGRTQLRLIQAPAADTQDIAFTTTAANRDSLHLTRSTGSGFVQVDSSEQFNPGRKLYGDFNGDGLTDVASLSDGNDNWEVWLADGSGDGTVSTFASWDDSQTWRNLIVGDFDDDGRDDVAARKNNGQWVVGLSTGSSFGEEVWGGLSTSGSNQWQNIMVADYDGDGRDDIAARLFNDNPSASGAWWVQLSTGSALQTTRWGRWSTNATWDDIHAADFNNDGRADIVGRTAAGTVWVGRSDGSMFTNEAWGSWDSSENWRAVHLGDFDGDGRTDILSQTADGSWYVSRSTSTPFNGSASGSFVQTRWSRWSTNVVWHTIQVGDFDGDGRTDIAGLTESNNWWVGLSRHNRFSTSHWGVVTLPGDPNESFGFGVGRFV